MTTSTPIDPPVDRSVTAWHLHLEDEPRSGAWNMAFDEALLLDGLAHGRGHLRFYRWEGPTLSLGYFQKPEERDPALAELPAVRRLSGGGAILHDDEWTYSCVVPAGHPITRRPVELYDLVHAAVVEVLSSRGFEVAPRGAAAAHGASPFLCFGRGDERDLVCRGHKVLGSAQRRRRGAILQHGSLLLHASRFAPDFPGLLDLQEGDLGDDYPSKVSSIVLDALGAVAASPPPHGVSEVAAQLVAEKYCAPSWSDGDGFGDEALS